jgi:hypothetical protein
MTPLSAQEIRDTEIAPDFEHAPAETVLNWALEVMVCTGRCNGR